VEVGNNNVFVEVNCSALNATDTDSSNELVIVNCGNEKLKGSVLFTLGRWHIFKNSIKKGR
jgi:hypothetical protein